uniref:Uncharacterized protein n=1 Tax=Davidia involucrata TaxID=16924 RepID=A0A5B7B2N6_DAVIN
MLTQAIRLELGTLELTNSMLLTLLELSSLPTQLSYIKLRLAIALKRKSGDRLSGLSWLNTLNAKGSHHMHIMHNIWHTLFPMDNLMEVASGRRMPNLHQMYVKMLNCINMILISWQCLKLFDTNLGKKKL